MAQNTFPHRRLLTLAAPLLAGALLVGACSKSNDTTTAGGNASTTAGGSSGTASGGGSTGNTKGTTTKGTTNPEANVDTKVWFQGFRYDLGELSQDPQKATVDIKTKITNLGTENASPYPPAAFVNGGEEVARGGLVETPTITGGKTVDATFSFSVKEDFTVNGTTFVLSNGSSQAEVKVPLDGKGDKVTLEPIEQAQTPDPITIGTVTITPKVAAVRWDIPTDHSAEAEAGKSFVVISGSAKNSGTNTAYFNASTITLTTSAGTYPAVIAGDTTTIPPNQSTDTFSFYFEVPEPVEGTWTMDLKDQPFGPDGSNVSATAQVTLSKQKKSTTGTTR